MVAKLMKHELYALFRILLFFAAAVLALAAAGRILIHFAFTDNMDSSPLATFTIFVIVFYVMAISAFAIAAYIIGISRFYRTLFTGEGYLTLSLPATADQLILSKILSALIGVIFAAAVSIISLTVFLVGWDFEIFETFGAISEGIAVLANMEPMLIVEGIVLLIVLMPMGLLITFALISIGQLFTVRRRVATFLIFIGVYFVCNTLLSLLLESMAQLFANLSPHAAIWIFIAITAAIDVGCYFIVRYILRNKVNLIA